MDYANSCRRLHELGFSDCEPMPPIPPRRPRHDDEQPFGVRFFRTRVGGDLSGLTLPRTFFGRSEISQARFCNSDLRESNLCWNDFIDVDFGKAILRNADLRASLFDRVSFVGTDLAAADLRQSTFENCAFDLASMARTVLTRQQGTTLTLSASQRSQIRWTDDEGVEPDGG